VNGNIQPFDGTSAAAPTVAAIFALINDKLLNNGKNPVGFVNPALYQVSHLVSHKV
jgi:tripeptidyl-peptidase I